MIERIQLENFRIYENLELELEEGLVVVMGPNAQGKTSLLEAIFLLSSGRVLRGMKDQEAIRGGASRSIVRGYVSPHSTCLQAVLERGVRKRISINGASLARASDVLGRLPSIIFSNLDLSIVRGDPSDRRQFLDTELAQVWPAYLRNLASYKLALEQRNALLKQAQTYKVEIESFEVWEEKIAYHGTEIRRLRSDALDQLRPMIYSQYLAIGGLEALEAHIISKDPEESLGDLLKSKRGIDIHRGSTTVGPHRDDLFLSLDSKDARLYGSMGQQRSLAIALKLAMAGLLERHSSEKPMFLLDDVMSELDQTRRRGLLELVCELSNQVVLTCNEMGADWPSVRSVLKVSEGKVKAE